MWQGMQSSGLVLVPVAPLQIRKKSASSSRHFTATQIHKNYRMSGLPNPHNKVFSTQPAQLYIEDLHYIYWNVSFIQW